MEKFVALISDMLNKSIAILIVTAVIGIIANLSFAWVISSKVMNFTERIRYEGYLTDEMYTNFLDEMVFDEVMIHITHTKEQKSLDEPLTIFSRKTILDQVFGSNHIYKFEVGDEVVVSVSARLFLMDVYIPQGGLILNEKYH